MEANTKHTKHKKVDLHTIWNPKRLRDSWCGHHCRDDISQLMFSRPWCHSVIN